MVVDTYSTYEETLTDLLRDPDFAQEYAEWSYLRALKIVATTPYVLQADGGRVYVDPIEDEIG